MTDLVSRINAAIDAREAGALAASPGPWRPNAEHDEIVAEDDITVAEGFALSGNQLRATVDHIVRHDPTSVVRMCQAHRKIVGAYVEFAKRRDEFERGDYPTQMIAAARAETAALGWVLEHLAEGYGITTEEGT